MSTETARARVEEERAAADALNAYRVTDRGSIRPHVVRHDRALNAVWGRATSDVAAALSVIDAAKADPRVQRHIEGKPCECCTASRSGVVDIDEPCPVRAIAHAVIAFEALP